MLQNKNLGINIFPGLMDGCMYVLSYFFKKIEATHPHGSKNNKI
jgi:hypothetical protein